MTERYWKVLDAEGCSCHGGDFRWSLPRWSKTRGWVPGAWTPRIANVAPCERGYHVCRDRDLLRWLGARIYACEVRGTVVVAEDKVVAESVRLLAPTPWDDVSARLFAVECAAEVLPIYERTHPGDARVSDCLVTAFRYALSDATDAERVAARSAASAAASAAAWDAARATASDAARSAASDAAWAAAWDAAWDAARTARTARSARSARLLWWLGVDDDDTDQAEARRA